MSRYSVSPNHQPHKRSQLCSAARVLARHICRYHMVVVISPVVPANGLANYFTYLNGDLYTAEANYPLIAAVPRPVAWLGRSGWKGADANFSGEIDLFNVYNVALSDVQVNERAAQLIKYTSCTAAPACSANPATVPAALYNLTFSSNPVAGQASATYGWQQSVSSDSTCSFVHQGVATFRGGVASIGGQYVNLSAATGPSSAGAAVPSTIGGAGSGALSDGTLGWSFEFTFLSGTESVNAKIWSMGAGEAVWNIFAGPDGQGTGANFGVYGGDGNYNNGASGIVEFVNPISTSQWYHVVAVVQQVTGDSSNQHAASYFIYVNGALLNFFNVSIYLNSHSIQAQARRMAYLAKSTWVADPYWSGAIDTFRIYDRALTQSQVASLHQGEMGGCAVPVQSTSTVISVLTPPNLLPRTANAFVSPLYSLNFATDPRLASSGSAFLYSWQNATADSSAASGVRQGVLILDGESQYVDLNAVSGPLSASSTALPMLGGGDSGWSFELIVKPGQAHHWAKLFDIGSARGDTPGACNNDITMGWDADTVQWQFDVCDASGHEHQTGDAFGNIQAGQWVHLVAVIAPAQSGSGLAHFLTYANGVLYTAEFNFQYPPAVPRQSAWLGRSGWTANNDANFTASLDLFSVYDVALSDAQVASLHQQNFKGLSVQWGTPAGGGSSASSGSSSSSLSNGAIAGIVIGSVVGAAVLLVTCWAFLRTASRGSKRSGSTGYDNHKDVSQVRSNSANSRMEEGDMETETGGVELTSH